jgi:general secretion pathway protein A
MTPELRQTVCDHALGNYRVMTAVASELLLSAVKQELPQLEEKLYLQHYSAPQAPTRRAPANR